MKKFLCYDTNDAVSGKINVDSRGMLNPNSMVPPTNGSTNQYLVTDSNGNMKWEYRLAYEGGSRTVVSVRDGLQLVKVADEVPSWVSVDAPIKCWRSSGDHIRKYTIIPSEYTVFGNGSFAANIVLIFVMTDNDEYDGVVFPEKGIYFLHLDEKGVYEYTAGIASADSDTPEITWDGNIGMVKKLDKKFLPDQTVFHIVNGKLVDERGNAITLKQAKAVGLDFIIQGPLGVARPISANYYQDYVSFCIADVASGGYELTDIRVGTSPD